MNKLKLACLCSVSYTALISHWHAHDPDPIIKDTLDWIKDVLLFKNG